MVGRWVGRRPFDLLPLQDLRPSGRRRPDRPDPAGTSRGRGPRGGQGGRRAPPGLAPSARSAGGGRPERRSHGSCRGLRPRRGLRPGASERRAGCDHPEAAAPDRRPRRRRDPSRECAHSARGVERPRHPSFRPGPGGSFAVRVPDSHDRQADGAGASEPKRHLGARLLVRGASEPSSRTRFRKRTPGVPQHRPAGAPGGQPLGPRTDHLGRAGRTAPRARAAARAARGICGGGRGLEGAGGAEPQHLRHLGMGEHLVASLRAARRRCGSWGADRQVATFTRSCRCT